VQELSDALLEMESSARVQALAASDSCKKMQENHEADAHAWSRERNDLKNHIARLQAEAAAAAATSSSAIEKLKTQV
jgi:hypothetical protein